MDIIWVHQALQLRANLGMFYFVEYGFKSDFVGVYFVVKRGF